MNKDVDDTTVSVISSVTSSTVSYFDTAAVSKYFDTAVSVILIQL